MRITDIKIVKHKIYLRKPFKIALGVIGDLDTMFVQVQTDEGIVGVGEGSPLEMITGETIEETLLVADAAKKLLLGRDPSDLTNLFHELIRHFPNNPAVRAAYDIALHDICARRQDLPLYKYLGGTRNEMWNDITIPIESLEDTIALTRDSVARGYDILKVKVGRTEELDVEMVSAVREAAGPNVKIFCDANQGWDRESAPQIINRLAAYDILFVEQPVPKPDVEGLALVRSQSKVPIMADESVFGYEDAQRVIQLEAADFVNIKLMKCGGIFNAMRINKLCESSGIRCVVGCMMDTPIAITAAASFAVAHDNVVFGDLDSLSHIKDCGIKSGTVQKGNKLMVSDQPGLGIDLDL